MAGNPSKTTQSTTNEPPKWELPYITAIAKAVAGKYLPGGELGESPLPDQQLADFTPDQQAAFNQIREFGTTSPLITHSQDRLSSLMDTPFVNPIDDVIQQSFWGKINAPAPDVYAMQAAHPQTGPSVYDLLKQNAGATQTPNVYDLMKQNPQAPLNVYDLLKQHSQPGPNPADLLKQSTQPAPDVYKMLAQGPKPLFSGGFPSQQSPYAGYLNALFGGTT
jgi:hypothetical protein